jgi:hypothetical protein
MHMVANLGWFDVSAVVVRMATAHFHFDQSNYSNWCHNFEILRLNLGSVVHRASWLTLPICMILEDGPHLSSSEYSLALLSVNLLT